MCAEADEQLFFPFIYIKTYAAETYVQASRLKLYHTKTCTETKQAVTLLTGLC